MEEKVMHRSDRYELTYVLLATGTVVVLVLDGIEQVHVEDLKERRKKERRTVRTHARE
jgi:hypothetical protein